MVFGVIVTGVFLINVVVLYMLYSHLVTRRADIEHTANMRELELAQQRLRLEQAQNAAGERYENDRYENDRYQYENK